ncbi:hypothetical protein [Glycomyces tenuis]|uniref:hypothetical protein n=1 Tax=Glycomyces tenuis TaxID=58116 RepID=UPI00041BC045|nr:hypothetical protein [Glycomyces tenuis]
MGTVISEQLASNLVIMAVDIRRFSSFTDTQRNEVAVAFRDAIEEAFSRADLAAVWNERQFEQNAGDGIVTGFAEHHLRNIVDRIPSTLQGQLRELHRHRPELNVRMRMGIAVGPIKALDDDRIDIAPNQPIIDACRIADSQPVRALLERSDENATYLAVGVTSRVITDVIQPDPQWVRDSEFVRVNISIEAKRYNTNAFLHVPTPSGALLQFGLVNLPTSPASDDDPEAKALEDHFTALKFFKNYVTDSVFQDRPVSGAPDGHAFGAGDVGRDARSQSIRTDDVGKGGVVAGGEVRKEDHSRDHSGQDRSTTYIGRDSNRFGGDGTISNVGRDQNTYRDEERQTGERGDRA